MVFFRTNKKITNYHRFLLPFPSHALFQPLFVCLSVCTSSLLVINRLQLCECEMILMYENVAPFHRVIYVYTLCTVMPKNFKLKTVSSSNCTCNLDKSSSFVCVLRGVVLLLEYWTAFLYQWIAASYFCIWFTVNVTKKKKTQIERVRERERKKNSLKWLTTKKKPHHTFEMICCCYFLS